MIDRKDKLLLYALNENPEDPLSKLGRGALLSKQMVKYRIDNLFNRGIIKNVIPLVNVNLLGFTVFNIYLKVEKPDEDLLEKLTNHPNIPWLVSTGGHYNIVGVVFAKNFKEISRIMINIFEICNNKVENYETLIIYEKYSLGYRFLNPRGECKLISSKEPPYYTNKDSAIYILTPIEKKILAELKDYSKTSVLNISEKLKISYSKVKGTIGRLRKNGILKGFQPVLDIKKLGYQWYQILIKLKTLNEAEFNRLISYLISIPQVIHINCCFGKWDINFELNVRDHAEYLRIIKGLQLRFSHLIKNQEELIIFDESKYNLLIDCIIGK